MKLSDLTHRAGEWLRGVGPMHDVVISSRVRLARNLAGMPFLGRCTAEQQRELETRLRENILAARLADEMLYVDVAAAGRLDREIVVERHLISRQHADGKHPRGVAISSSETIAIMVNEEDHLRVQVLRSGLQLREAFEDLFRIDRLLEDRLGFAFHDRYGYLTACPTNVGTGLRVSVMLHLPALKLTGQIEKVFRAAKELRLAIRGLYGEGTEATGDFFQVSNQTTLGKTEEQILEEFRTRMVPNFIDYERRARHSLMRKQVRTLEDRVCRADAALRSARLISAEETMYMLSLVRLGASVGLIKDPDVHTINELFLQTQPAHLQRLLNREMDGTERAAARSDFIRRRLSQN